MGDIDLLFLPYATGGCSSDTDLILSVFPVQSDDVFVFAVQQNI